MPPLTKAAIVTALGDLDIGPGEILFVHSSLNALGPVDGGANTLVDALLQVLGPEGTLAMPTFTFSLDQSGNPIFDPAASPSEMGAITEALRRRPAAHRSHHLLHSVAALGPQAEALTRLHGASAWAGDGPFWQLYARRARILLLGVSYLRCTFFHLIEQLVAVPYRQWRIVDAQCRQPDGSLAPLPTHILWPRPGFEGNDFNKFGRRFEKAGKVDLGPVGNAVGCLFAAADALEEGIAHYRRDPRLFVRDGSEFTPLTYGVLTDPPDQHWVIDPSQTYRNQVAR